MSKLAYFGLAILALVISACGFDGVEPKGEDESSLRLETSQTAFCVVLSHEVNLPLGKLEACSEVDEDGLHFVEFSPIKIGVYDADFVPDGDFHPFTDDIVVDPGDHNVTTITFAEKSGGSDPVDPAMLAKVKMCVSTVDAKEVSVTVTEIKQGLNDEPFTFTNSSCKILDGLPRGLDLQFSVEADGYDLFKTEVVHIMGAEVPSLNVTLHAKEELAEGALSFSADGETPKYMVFLGGESLPLTLPPVYQVQDGVRVQVTGFTCGHEMADRVSVDAECTTISPGGEVGCEVITVSYGDDTIEIHATNVDRDGFDSPADWDRGPVCQ